MLKEGASGAYALLSRALSDTRDKQVTPCRPSALQPSSCGDPPAYRWSQNPAPENRRSAFRRTSRSSPRPGVAVGEETRARGSRRVGDTI